MSYPETGEARFRMWNLALDLAFNEAVADLVGDPPSLSGHAERFATMTAEEIYRELSGTDEVGV